MHGEMAQAGFAGGDGHGGAPHVAQHEGGEQSEAGESDRDERHHAVHDLGARLRRRPGEAGDDMAVGVGDAVGVVAGRRRRLAERAQVVEPQLPGDIGEDAVLDEFHRDDDRRVFVAQRRRVADQADGGGGDDGGAVEETGDDDRARMDAGLAVARRREPRPADEIGGTAAHVIE